MLNLKITGKKIWKEINRSKSILLHIHSGPDGDSVGSALAFYFALQKMGKNVVVIGGDSDLPQNLSVIPGANKIIPKNFFQVDLNQFDLFIILDSSSPSQISRNGKIVFPKNLKTIAIDHHFSNEKFAQINLIMPKYSSTCQIIYDLFQLGKIKINKNIAACLFIGIYTDTGGFKYFNPTYKTFDIASKLAKIYPKFDQLVFGIENNDHPNRLKLISLLLNSIENHFSNHIAIASISYDEIKKNDLDNDTLNGYSEVTNMLKSVIGWDIAMTMIELQPNLVRLNFRTRDAQTYDLSKIAAATGSGGGHKAAAGATVHKSLPEAKQFILNIIKKLYPKIDK
ncbi:MAG: DHH family phosphoesterase [Candidatus Shapirobacteria bacterium]|nr:DHH family phosphoesterase [Candidatus Shapirobacteria bacterium]